MRLLRDLIRHADGAAAAEFALVLPLFLALVFAIVSFGTALFSYTQLHFATEDAARCYSIKTDVCDNATDTRTYALSRYVGPNIHADFPAATITQTGACYGSSQGHSVTGTGSFSFHAGFVNFSLPMSATACFP